MTDDILARYPGVAGTPLAMALMCTPLLALGRHDDAYAMGRAALVRAPTDTAVADLVRKALSANVPPFHLGMLRDEPRNSCYAAAIERLVRPGMQVLEIGTGSGLLALLAARAGATVVTCESNPVIAAAARAIVAANGFADRIRVVGKLSTDLVVGIDLDRPADLLVSEVFGAGLFEEGVVASIADARARLLRADAAIVPPRAALRCALAGHDRLDRGVLDTVLGFDLSPFTSLTRPRRHLSNAPDPRVALRSMPVTTLAVDFAGAPIRTLHDRVALISEGGRVDGIAQWLHLDFGDGVTYENPPFDSPLAHWAVLVHPFATPLETAPGEVVAADARVFGRELVVSLVTGA